MSEYIEREAARDVRERPPITQAIKGGEKSICWSCFHWKVCFAKENQPCIKCTRYIPAADVQPVVRGKWKHGVCQTCFFDWSGVAPFATVPNFCPNCGAKMEEN